MKKYFSLYYLIIFDITCLLLSIIQIVPEKPLLIAERFVVGLGWAEVILFSFLAVFIAEKFNNTSRFPHWRKWVWFSFTVFFFSQVILGLFGIEECLMTGKLHFPIPAMIIGGPIYRGELTFMIFLFVGTVLITGPAWCSQLCYFGSFDLLFSGTKSKRFDPKNMFWIKYSVLILFIAIVLILRIFHISHLYAIIFASLFGIIGVCIMLVFSMKYKKMIHCTYFCPIGSIVTLSKWINPFRITIDSSCDQCMKCTIVCKYNALQVQNVKSLKPGLTCTNCGDCISVCPQMALQYHFFNFSAKKSKKLYVAVVVIVFTVFFAVARI